MRNSNKVFTPLNIVIVAAVLAVVYMVFYRDSYDASEDQEMAAPGGDSGMGVGNLNATGVSSNLLPKPRQPIEEASSLLPSDVLKGESLINASEVMRYPETISGSLRNSNRQIRSEPVNPRKPVSIFWNSTIEPDTMRRTFEIGGADY